MVRCALLVEVMKEGIPGREMNMANRLAQRRQAEGLRDMSGNRVCHGVQIFLQGFADDRAQERVGHSWKGGVYGIKAEAVASELTSPDFGLDHLQTAPIHFHCAVGKELDAGSGEPCEVRFPVVEPEEFQPPCVILQPDLENPGPAGKEPFFPAGNDPALNQGEPTFFTCADRTYASPVLIPQRGEKEEVEDGVNALAGKMNGPLRAHALEGGKGKGDGLELFDIAAPPEAQRSSFQPWFPMRSTNRQPPRFSSIKRFVVFLTLIRS